MMHNIKDSGERTAFASGAVRDMQAGKGRMDLLPWAAIMEVSKHCEAGALKYGEHNVDKGIPTHSLMSSAMRHAAKYMEGETDEDHLLAAAWNLLWAVQMRLTHPECVDTPWREEKKGEPVGLKGPVAWCPGCGTKDIKWDAEKDICICMTCGRIIK